MIRKYMFIFIQMLLLLPPAALSFTKHAPGLRATTRAEPTLLPAWKSARPSVARIPSASLLTTAFPGAIITIVLFHILISMR